MASRKLRNMPAQVALDLSQKLSGLEPSTIVAFIDQYLEGQAEGVLGMVEMPDLPPPVLLGSTP